MKFNLANIKTLCAPAKVYLFFGLLILLGMMKQNVSDSDNIFCFGNYECYVENKWILIVSKIIYIGFWTFILNVLCRGGYKNLSWFLILFPVILFFLLIILFLWANGAQTKLQEGMTQQTYNNRRKNIINKYKLSLDNLESQRTRGRISQNDYYSQRDKIVFDRTKELNDLRTQRDREVVINQKQTTVVISPQSFMRKQNESDDDFGLRIWKTISGEGFKNSGGHKKAVVAIKGKSVLLANSPQVRDLCNTAMNLSYLKQNATKYGCPALLR